MVLGEASSLVVYLVVMMVAPLLPVCIFFVLSAVVTSRLNLVHID